MTPNTSLAWLFGDLGRPLLAPRTKLTLERTLPSDSLGTLHQILEEHRSNSAGKKKQHLEEVSNHSKLELIRFLTRMNEGQNGNLFKIGIGSGKTALVDRVRLDSLPWLPESWDRLKNLGFVGADSVYELVGQNWGALASHSNQNWEIVLDVIQILNDWLPIAIEHQLLSNVHSTFDEEAMSFARALLFRAGLTDENRVKWGDLLIRRMGWGVPPETLDEIAAEFSLSRERVRQIESILVTLAKSREYVATPNALKLANVDFGTRLGDPVERIRSIVPMSVDWSFAGVESYLELAISNLARTALITNAKIDASRKAEHKAIQAAIRNARTELGVLKPRSIFLQGETDPINLDLIMEHLSVVYPGAIFADEYAIVSRGKDAGYFTAVANQLSVCSPLKIDQLLPGLERQAIVRQAQHLLPSRETAVKILKQNPDFQVDADGFVSGRQEKIMQDGVQGWLVQQIMGSGGQVISKAQIFRLAAAEDQRFTSLAIYMSYSPVIRSLGDGLLTLVGSHPSEDEIAFAERVASANYVANRVSEFGFLPETSTLRVRFCFSSPFLVSGVLAVDRVLGDALGSNARKVTCCSLRETDAIAKLSKGTNLAGFASIREHMMLDHGVQEGDIVEFEADSDAIRMIW